TTTGTDVFKATAKNPKGHVGLEHVDELVSLDGIELYKDHKYELVSVYDNPTKQNVDSMASMYFGAEDPEFVAPTAAELAERGVVVTDNTVLVLRTADGDIGATLIRNPASLEFAKLVAGGAFRDAEATVGDATITFVENRPTAPLPHDANTHTPGAISLCTAPDALSFVIVTRSAPDLDGRCSVIGRLGPGSDVVRAMAVAGSGKILRAEIVSGPELEDLHLAPARKVAAK